MKKRTHEKETPEINSENKKNRILNSDDNSPKDSNFNKTDASSQVFSQSNLDRGPEKDINTVKSLLQKQLKLKDSLDDTLENKEILEKDKVKLEIYKAYLTKKVTKKGEITAEEREAAVFIKDNYKEFIEPKVTFPDQAQSHNQFLDKYKDLPKLYEYLDAEIASANAKLASIQKKFDSYEKQNADLKKAMEEKTVNESSVNQGIEAKGKGKERISENTEQKGTATEFIDALETDYSPFDDFE